MCETHVVIQVKTMAFKVLSQWSPKKKSLFQWVQKISQLLSWHKSKPWCLRLACHNEKISHVTHEIHVIMQAQTITFEVSSKWSSPKKNLLSMGAKCVILVRKTCYIWMNTHM
jgi:hypothetical protein